MKYGLISVMCKGTRAIKSKALQGDSSIYHNANKLDGVEACFYSLASMNGLRRIHGNPQEI